MIANITRGDYVKGMVMYNHSKTIDDKPNKATAVFLGTNAISDTFVNGIINSIVRQNKLNSDITKPNIHISLNFHKDDVLNNATIYQIAADYMDDMGYGEQPYAVYRHFDTDHPHVHIVSSQINTDGDFIKDNFLFRRSYKTTRELEEKYNITKAVGSRSTLENSIQQNISNYFTHNNVPLLPLLDNIITKVLEQKPTSLQQFDYLLKTFQVIREERSITQKGHVFKLLPLDQIEQETFNSFHYGISGREIDFNFSYPAIIKTIELNKLGKDKLLRMVQGKVYSVIDTIKIQYSQSVGQFKCIT